MPVPLVVEGKTVGSITLKAGSQVSVISILPNNGGVVISRGEGSPFIVPQTALTKESILLAIATASATPTPSPTPLAATPPPPAIVAKPSCTISPSQPQEGAAAESDFTIASAGGIATIIGYKGPGGNVVIPNTIQGFPVGIIASGAFNGAKIVSVVIPDTVTKIEGRSFQRCEILAKIVLPKALEEFGGFGLGLNSLKVISINQENQNFSVSSDGVLFDSAKTQLLAYPAGKREIHYTIPETVTELGFYSFANTKNLRSVDLPASLIKIGTDAFNESGIHEITIPNKVTSIDNFAFRYCSNLENVSIGNECNQIGMGAFVGCSKLKKVQFEGNAPSAKENNTFAGTAKNFKVYYHSNAEGFSSPFWVDSSGARWCSEAIEH